MSARLGGYLGVDVGTSSVKAGVVGDDGRPVAVASRPVNLTLPQEGYVEQDMGAVWTAVVEVVRSVLTRVSDVEIRACAVTGQGDGAWFLDERLEPVGRAATWMDGRSAEIVRRWRRGGQAAEIEAVTWGGVFPGALPPLAAWWQQERPRDFERARWHLNAKDWVGLRLTGELATDPTEAARVAMPMARWPHGPFEFDAALLERLGLDALAEKLPPILRSGETRGRVTPAASEETGLPVGTPVAVGVIDGVAVAMGMGATEPGDGFGIVGTTASYGCVGTEPPARGPTVGLWLPNGVRPGYHCALAPASGAPALDWVRRLLGTRLTFEELETLARSSPPGARGVRFLPHLSPGGERAPFAEPGMRGALLGLSFGSSAEDIARAAYEGMAFVMAECLRQLAPVTSVALGGGGARSDVLAQTIADVLGVRVDVVEDSEVGVLGAASLAAGLQGVVLPGSPVDRTFEPNPSLAEVYAGVGRHAERERAALREIAAAEY